MRTYNPYKFIYARLQVMNTGRLSNRSSGIAVAIFAVAIVVSLQVGAVFTLVGCIFPVAIKFFEASWSVLIVGGGAIAASYEYFVRRDGCRELIDSYGGESVRERRLRNVTAVASFVGCNVLSLTLIVVGAYLSRGR